MSFQSLTLRRMIRKHTNKLNAEDYLLFVHKVDEIQRLEPRGGDESSEVNVYWGVINRQLKYTGNNFFVNLMSITPDFIKQSFFYNEEPEKYNADMTEPRNYDWGDTYDIDEDDAIERKSYEAPHARY